MPQSQEHKKIARQIVRQIDIITAAFGSLAASGQAAGTVVSTWSWTWSRM